MSAKPKSSTGHRLLLKLFTLTVLGPPASNVFQQPSLGHRIILQGRMATAYDFIYPTAVQKVLTNYYIHQWPVLRSRARHTYNNCNKTNLIFKAHLLAS